MKKLTTIALAVLILCLQVFSCVAVYAAEDNILIWDRGIIRGNPPISQNETFVYKLKLKNKNETKDVN